MNTLDEKIEKEFLDLNHRYSIVIALDKEHENELIDCHFYNDYGEFKDGFMGMYFNEKKFLLMEKYLFNFINTECDLLISMYEEEWAEAGKLPQILEITSRMINNSDNQEFLKSAKEFKKIVEKAIELDTFIGFCF